MRYHVVLRLVVTALCAAATALVARDARADDIEAARRDFAEGVRLYQGGDYEGARRLFKKAEAAHHAAAIVYNLAFAEERLFHLQAAVDAYESYVAEVGAGGEFSSAATIAIAQIKARSTRLRIDTKPAGARLTVDGFALAEPAPTTHLLPAGHHVVVAEGDGWRREEDVEVRGKGDVLNVVIKATAADEPALVVPPSAVPAKEPPATSSPTPVNPVADSPAPNAPALPSGFVWGAAFAVAPYHLAGATGVMKNTESTTRVFAGGIFEIGHAVTDRFEFLARGFVAFGPEGGPTYAAMGGPGISLRVGSHLWLGATFLGGQLETKSRGVRYGTDLVFGAMTEVTFIVLGTPYGQWTVGVQPGLLLTDNPDDNTAFFFPIAFGYRGF